MTVCCHFLLGLSFSFCNVRRLNNKTALFVLYGHPLCKILTMRFDNEAFIDRREDHSTSKMEFMHAKSLSVVSFSLSSKTNGILMT